ncbi:threonine synthase [Paenibacillus psychroresistens]|uniref:Threonine synthase n=1 Tax=Paenibacillus psychroresistens TaxID=1778678 RepID=A0A6B8RJ30_9BACL|nr:threonine synthase [Paenibacillus psychroresistens]QGQ96471.1 threonine synthase [Paenibacillus psychroresistens]
MDCFLLKCTLCNKTEVFALKGKCECGGTLLVEYDIELAARTFTKANLKQRHSSMWKYHELLPITNPNCIVSLGEGYTPLIRLNTWEQKLPLGKLYIKREEQNPTGSFKARGFSAALTLLKERGIVKAAVPSNGNAASAFAAYSGRAGIDAYVFIPQDCPYLIVEECLHYGAKTYLVDGLIHDAGAIVEAGKVEQGWFNVGTLREPGRVEGKKTMGFEIAEQLEWTLPDVIIYPTGGGSGVIGLWRAFSQLLELGLVNGEMPRIAAVQEYGCTPICDAFQETGLTVYATLPAPTGMRVPEPPDRQLVASIIRKMNGTTVTVTQAEIRAAAAATGLSGISSSPEGAATWAGMLRLCETGWIQKKDKVVLFNTSHAMKYSAGKHASHIPLIKSYQDFLDVRK